MPSLLYKKEGRLLVLYLLCVTVVSTIVFISFPVDEPLLGIPDFPESDFFPPLYDAPPIDVVEQPLPLPYFGEQGVWMFLSHPKNVRIMLVLFVLVFNICVRLFFFTIRRDEHFKELEKEKLRSELEYLKYQINPHFFMNSLNNIHALIDIDKEKAQGAVREMSKLMRYVLYDKASMFIPLEKEIQFLESYVDLMRLRYTEKLEIKVFFASDVQDVYVPSLLFMQFVENAFKHGVTYKKQSFIEISLTVDEANEIVLFTCRNTLPDAGVKTAISAAGGIGVENAKKRLGLLFGDKACLNIDNTGEWYNVELKIPIQNDQVYNC